jgi:hypothetical protein
VKARDEGGFVLVVVLVAIVAIIAVAALVLDGGRAYAVRRHMQNAADSAAIAATSALDKVLFRGASPSSVDATARNELAANGAQIAGPLYGCAVIDQLGSELAGCEDTSPLTGWMSPLNFPRADGVRVNAAMTEPTAFGSMLGTPTVTAQASAAATIRPLVAGDSPFLVCGNRDKGAQVIAGQSLLVPDPARTPPWKINPLAVNLAVPFQLHGPHVPACGANSQAFKGLAGEAFTVPRWMQTTTGVRAGPTRSLVASRDGCSSTNLDSCILLVPICVDGRGSGSSIELYCVAVGAFLVRQVSANEHTGVLQPGAVGVGGDAGSGVPDPTSVRVYKLLS